MITPNEARKQYAFARTHPDSGEFCPSAVLWVRRRLSLREAWERCNIPSWMCWWLFMFCHEPEGQNLCVRFNDDIENKAQADMIRARYTYWGKLRSRS